MTGAWILRRTARRLRQGKAALATLSGLFAIVGALAAGAMLLSRASADAVGRLAAEAHVVVYLDRGLDTVRIQALASALARRPDVARAETIDGPRALDRLRSELAALGEDAAILGHVEESFLPPSIEVALVAGVDLPVRAAELAARLRRLDGVTTVDAVTEGMARLESWLDLVRGLRLALLVLAVAIAAVAVLWSVTSARARGREEAAALALVGVTPAAMRLPAGLAWAVCAALGAILGVGLGDLAARALSVRLHLGDTPAMGAHEIGVAVLGLGVLGLVAGWYSLPRPRREGQA